MGPPRTKSATWRSKPVISSSESGFWFDDDAEEEEKKAFFDEEVEVEVGVEASSSSPSSFSSSFSTASSAASFAAAAAAAAEGEEEPSPAAFAVVKLLLPSSSAAPALPATATISPATTNPLPGLARNASFVALSAAAELAPPPPPWIPTPRDQKPVLLRPRPEAASDDDATTAFAPMPRDFLAARRLGEATRRATFLAIEASMTVMVPQVEIGGA